MIKKHSSTWALLSFILILSTNLNAQTHQKAPQDFRQSVFYEKLLERKDTNTPIIKCAASEYDQYLNSINPAKETIVEFESWLAPKVKEYKRKNQTLKATDAGNIITIPVVVHVIHDNKAYGVAENITDEQVLSQITVLNQDFRKMINTPGHNNHPVGADLEIEFCLAQRTPTGQPTTGINRLNIPTPIVSSPMGEFVTWTMEDIEAELKPSTVWDSEEYLNIWVVENILLGIVAGYAQFPTSSGLEGLEGGSLNEGGKTDGVVVGYNCFGSSDIYPGGTYIFPYTKGRTTTHEVGHWMGLRHIWGDNSSCSVDATDSLNDYCLDTPAANDANQGCAQTSSCSVASMIENYMDYTDDSCQNTFTEDQKARTSTVMANSPRRKTLATSSGCIAPKEFDAKIGIIDLGAPCNLELSPIISLSNVGTTTVITSAEISYGIVGENPQTYSWTGILDIEDSTEITLPLTVFEQTSEYAVSLVSVNGTMDDNLLNNSKSDIKAISSTYTTSTVNLSLTTDNWGDETSWELINNTAEVVVAQGGNYSGNQTFNETFELVPGDCYTFTIYDQYGDGICCDYGQGSYTLSAGTEVIASGGSFGVSESTSFMIDIDATGSITAYDNWQNAIRLYPNPTNSVLNIVIDGTLDLPENLTIYTTLGQVVKDQKINNSSDLSVDVGSLANGVYIIEVTRQNKSKTLRFIKQ